MCIVKNQQPPPCMTIRQESKMFNKLFLDAWVFAVHEGEDNQLQTVPTWTCIWIVPWEVLDTSYWEAERVSGEFMSILQPQQWPIRNKIYNKLPFIGLIFAERISVKKSKQKSPL